MLKAKFINLYLSAEIILISEKIFFINFLLKQGIISSYTIGHCQTDTNKVSTFYETLLTNNFLNE